MRRLLLKWLWIACLTMLSLLLVSACSETGTSSAPSELSTTINPIPTPAVEESSTSIAAESPTPSPEPVTVTVIATDFDWEISQSTFKVDQQIIFQIMSNEGHHGFGLSGTSINVELPAKDTVTITWIPEKPGTYTIRCTLYCGTGHGSMRTTIKVE